jgi:hypothetical protein
MGESGNESLLKHFHNRVVWELDPNLDPPRLTRLSAN